MIPRIFILNISIFILLASNILIANTFLPSNNSNLNYRQLEFSWPQIPNSNNYKITMNDVNSDLSLLIDSDDNILIYDGYNLEWGESYTWEVCGFSNNNLIECHDQKYFNINDIPIETIPSTLEIIHLNENAIQDGIAIFSGIFQQGAIGLGIDKYGEILFYINHRICYKLLPNGNILSLAIGQRTPGIQELTLNNSIIYNSLDLGFHHSAFKTNNGSYFGLVQEQQVHPCPSECTNLTQLLFPYGIIWEGDKIIELNTENEIIWEWNLFDEIGINNYFATNIENLGPANNYIVDWTHSNEVFYDNQDNAVYLSIRNLNTITKIDYETKEVIWHLGDLDTLGNNSYFNESPTFNHQHTPILLDNGNLIIFDNGGIHPGDSFISKCQEYSINNNSFELVWEYILPDSLYTGARGECHRLDNNNTLIAAGQTGNFIEIDNNNEIIWHGVVKSNSGSNQIGRIMKLNNLYPSSFNIEYNNYSGNIESPYIDIIDNNFSFNLINNGWMDDEYHINITDNNNFQYNNIVSVTANTSHAMNIDISDLIDTNQNTSNLEIEVYSNNKNLS